MYSTEERKHRENAENYSEMQWTPPHCLLRDLGSITTRLQPKRRGNWKTSKTQVKKKSVQIFVVT